MTNGAGEFVKHKFDMLLLVLLVTVLLSGIAYAEHWHDNNLVIWDTNIIAGLVGAFINMLTNRASAAERLSDSPGSVTITPPTSNVQLKTPEISVATAPPENK